MQEYEEEQHLHMRQGRSFVWIVAVLVFIGLVVTVALFAQRDDQYDAITNFDECKALGGAIAESYPEQCIIDGRTFRNDAQSLGSSGDYIGLTEKDALAKAERDGANARVVAREGKSLPVTMDYVEGRLNLTIQNGVVHRVGVEGLE